MQMRKRMRAARAAGASAQHSRGNETVQPLSIQKCFGAPGRNWMQLGATASNRYGQNPAISESKHAAARIESHWRVVPPTRRGHRNALGAALHQSVRRRIQSSPPWIFPRQFAWLFYKQTGLL